MFQKIKQYAKDMLIRMNKEGINEEANIVLPIYKIIAHYNKEDLRRKKIMDLFQMVPHHKFGKKLMRSLLKEPSDSESVKLSIEELQGTHEKLGAIEFYKTIKTIALNNEQHCIKNCNEATLLKIKKSHNPHVKKFYTDNKAAFQLLLSQVHAYALTKPSLAKAIAVSGGSPLHKASKILPPNLQHERLQSSLGMK